MSIYKRQIGALVIGQFSALFISFLVPIALAHILTSENFGLYSQFNLIVVFCMSFFSFGISSELYFFYPKADSDKRKVLINQSFLILLFLGLSTFLLFFIPSFRGLLVTNEFLESNYLFLSLSILFSIPTVIISVLYVLNHDNRTSALYLPISTVLRVILIFVWYLSNPTIKSIFFALLTYYVLLFLFVAYYIMRELKNNPGSQWVNFSLVKKQISYSIPLGIANSSRIFAQQLDKLILLSFVTPSAFAIYSISFYGVPGLNQLYLAISQVYIPRMSNAFFETDFLQVKNLYNSLVLKTLCYTVPIIFIIVVFAPIIVPFLFSDKYEDSIPYFQVYLFTFIFSALGSGIVLRSTGETRKSLYAYLYSLILIIPIAYFGIKWYGLNGAIFSAVISNILPRVLLTYYDFNVLGITIKQIFPWRQMMKIFFISFLLLIPFLAITLFFKLNIFSAMPLILVYVILVFLIEAHYGVFLISKKEIWSYSKRLLSKGHVKA